MVQRLPKPDLVIGSGALLSVQAHEHLTTFFSVAYMAARCSRHLTGRTALSASTMHVVFSMCCIAKRKGAVAVPCWCGVHPVRLLPCERAPARASDTGSCDWPLIHIYKEYWGMHAGSWPCSWRTSSGPWAPACPSRCAFDPRPLPSAPASLRLRTPACSHARLLHGRRLLHQLMR